MSPVFFHNLQIIEFNDEWSQKGPENKAGSLKYQKSKITDKIWANLKEKKREKGEKFLEAGDHPMLEYSIIVRLSHKRSKNEGK